MGRDATDFAALRAAIRQIERSGAAFGKAVVTTGHTGLDGHLPGGGFMCGTCHEIGGAAASGFAAALAGRALARGGYLFWCQTDVGMRRLGGAYGPGLRRFGIAPDRLVHVRAPDLQALLWASEEIARSKAAACLLAETGTLDLLTGRRLQLAAEEGGGLVLLLRHGRRNLQPSAALTRIEARPALAGWHIELWRAKGAAPANWRVIWQEGEKNALSLDPNPGFLACPDGVGEPKAGLSLAS